MTAYLVMQITITDPKRWGDYREAVMPLIARFGGRHASEAEGVVMLEGCSDERRIALFEFASVDDIQAFWKSPEYEPVKKLRKEAAVLEAWAVPAVPRSTLPKGS